MIGFHDVDIEGFAADGTFAALSFIDLTARVDFKSANTQMVDVAVEDIGKKTAFLLYSTNS